MFFFYDYIVREDVGVICNLSQGIREKGRDEGVKEIILNMYANGFTLEQIAVVTKKSVEEVSAVIKKREILWA